MDLGIKGKCAAVAAGSAGLGLGVAKALAGEGVRVAICGRDTKRLKTAVGAVAGEVIGIESDVSSPDGGASFVKAATKKLGQIDILVTNAGGPPRGTFASTERSDYRLAFEMNCLSMIEMCRVAIPAMRGRRWGRVCAIKSIGVKQPIEILMASSVARAGLTSFLKITAREVAVDGVTVNSCQPGTHWTERAAKVSTSEEAAASKIPVGFTGNPDDFGATVAFLCSEKAKFITGTGLLVDGGQATGLLD